MALEGFEERAFHFCGHVQAVHDAISSDVVEQVLLKGVVVVTVVQGAGAGEEVNVFATVLCDQPCTFCFAEHRGEGADVSAHFGFTAFEHVHIHGALHRRCSARRSSTVRSDPPPVGGEVVSLAHSTPIWWHECVRLRITLLAVYPGKLTKRFGNCDHIGHVS